MDLGLEARRGRPHQRRGRISAAANGTANSTATTARGVGRAGLLLERADLYVRARVPVRAAAAAAVEPRSGPCTGDSTRRTCERVSE